MQVRALRGVCIGVERHLAEKDVVDLDPATGKYLIGIGAVEEVVPEPEKPEPAAAPEPADDTQDSDAGKPAKRRG